MYGRKSTANDRSARSLLDQKEVCFEIAEEFGIPVSSESWMEEEAGHGGDEWWASGGFSGLIGDNSNTGRIRPVFTDLMQSVVNGTTKLIITYSIDRLWRSAEIGAKAIDLMRLHNCRLMDHTGFVDIFSASGRERTLISSVHAQMMREYTKIACERGVSKSKSRGLIIGNCNSLSFRSLGPHTGKVRFVPEEIEIANRIFRLYYSGENGEGPLSPDQIAWRLMDEGYIWTPDLHNKRSVKRTDATKHQIYDNQIRRVLSDVRLVGKQMYKGQEYDCPNFLHNGEPIVPYEMFDRVQEKLKQQSRGSHASVNTYALSSRVRCGICGAALTSQTQVVDKAGTKTKRLYWMRRNGRASSACPHVLPTIRHDVLDDFIDTTLSKLLVKEIRDRGLDNPVALAEQQLSKLQRELSDAERHYREELPKYHRRGIDPDLLLAMQNDAKSEIERLRGAVRKLMAGNVKTINAAHDLENIANASPAIRRDALRAVIRWIAVLPSKDRVARSGRNAQKPADNMGSLVVLTSFNTYLTIRIIRSRELGSHANNTKLRLATLEESVGGVADFPDPKSFYDGIQWAFDHNVFDYDAESVTPGYSPYSPAKIAEFDIQGD